MRSRRTKVLTVIAGIAAIAVLGGNAARGSEDAVVGLEPAVTVTHTPYAAASKASAGARAQAAAAKWVVTKVVDGDTIWAARAGETRKIRIIGIDTPEVGQCGYSEASHNLRSIIGGQPVTLTGGARDDADSYGRLLRYVDVNGVDAGLRQVKQGFAIARYDSRDGYGRHAREAAYVQADRSSPKAPCATPATSGSGGAPAAEAAGFRPAKV